MIHFFPAVYLNLSCSAYGRASVIQEQMTPTDGDDAEAYDLAAFTNSDGPYTLNEIYQTFSFCDKIQSIQDHATKERIGEDGVG